MAQSNESPPGGVSRRSFLVTLGGAVLGSYFLPALGGAKETAAAVPEVAPAAEAVRRVISPPTLTKSVHNRFFLLWYEQTESGVAVKYWGPETDEEIAEAMRFYEDARRYDTQAGKQSTAPVRRIDARERALIDAILDHLDDDAPRLAYADWLHAHGSSQGEFVRLWCVTDRMSESQPTYDGMMKRWWALLKQDAEKWFEPLGTLGLRPMSLGDFLPYEWLKPKGLIEEIEIDKPGVLPERAEHLFAAAPVLHKIALTYNLPDVAGLAALPQMAQLTSLKLEGVGLTLKHLRALVSSPHLTRLKELDVSNGQFGPQAGPLLADSALLGGLQTLNIGYCYLRRGVASLAASPRCTQLRTLDLRKNQLGLEAIRALASSPYLGRLTSLNLSGHQWTAEMFRALGAAPFLARLTTLRLGNNGMPPAAITALAELPLTALTTLDLETTMTKVWAPAKKQDPESGITWMVEKLLPMPPDGLRRVATSPHLSRLRELDLSWGKLGDAGAAALADPRCPFALVSLNLAHAEIGDQGLIALASAPHFQKLTELNLQGNKFGPAGAGALAGSPYFRELTKLDLSDNAIGPGGAQALAGSPVLTKLKSLTVTRSAVGQDGEAALRERFGKALTVRVEMVRPAALPTAADSKDNAVAKDLESLKGEWRLVSRMQNGQETPTDTIKNRVIAFDGNYYTIKDGDKLVVTAYFEIDPMTTPKWFDLAIISEGKTMGKFQLGLFKIDGDTLSFCIAGPGDTRPDDFIAMDGSGRILTMYKRLKK